MRGKPIKCDACSTTVRIGSDEEFCFKERDGALTTLCGVCAAQRMEADKSGPGITQEGNEGKGSKGGEGWWPEVHEVLGCFQVMPYGIVGYRRAGRNEALACAVEPDASTAVVDPAGLQYIRRGPAEAGGASTDLYRWAGISSFPEEVQRGLTKELRCRARLS